MIDPPNASPLAEDHDVLADLASFGILVIWHGVLADRQSEHGLEMAIKSELRRAGIEFQQTTAVDFLALDVFASEAVGPGGFSYCAQITCPRQLVLVRPGQPPRLILASPWSRTAIGYVPDAETLGRLLVNKTAELTKAFIIDYLTAKKH